MPPLVDFLSGPVCPIRIHVHLLHAPSCFHMPASPTFPSPRILVLVSAMLRPQPSPASSCRVRHSRHRCTSDLSRLMSLKCRRQAAEPRLLRSLQHVPLSFSLSDLLCLDCCAVHNLGFLTQSQPSSSAWRCLSLASYSSPFLCPPQTSSSMIAISRTSRFHCQGCDSHLHVAHFASSSIAHDMHVSVGMVEYCCGWSCWNDTDFA